MYPLPYQLRAMGNRWFGFVRGAVTNRFHCRGVIRWQAGLILSVAFANDHCLATILYRSELAGLEQFICLRRARATRIKVPYLRMGMPTGMLAVLICAAITSLPITPA